MLKLVLSVAGASILLLATVVWSSQASAVSGVLPIAASHLSIQLVSCDLADVCPKGQHVVCNEDSGECQCEDCGGHAACPKNASICCPPGTCCACPNGGFKCCPR
jgi:hypothetical protein